jgi:hypothetical protein
MEFKEDSWVLSAESVSEFVTSLLARVRSISGLVTDRAWARL